MGVAVQRHRSKHRRPRSRQQALAWYTVRLVSGAAEAASERFSGLLLRFRGRTGLTQRELAARVGASRRVVQDWEAGVNVPSADRLQALCAVLLEAGGLSAGHEDRDARTC